MPPSGSLCFWQALTAPGDLRGKVVLVNSRTYGCVNCINALPHAVAFHARYKHRASS